MDSDSCVYGTKNIVWGYENGTLFAKDVWDLKAFCGQTFQMRTDIDHTI